ncbi:hypothetical protein LA345_41035 (plasmid) [Burkholderia vietnamiensis]|uniref:Uncharacterized protein n=1 Tax=Burkholderia vietnamiensis (strain G4 / LMG 22486) TaxID=269482 RepID=A4JTQ4_BURVG|nr:hypothetical protein Bcep1808_6769 [Burkholderia vietnamiensis G4]MCB4350183.1 hypothetical protein [Burkholderia vietnamiensis]
MEQFHLFDEARPDHHDVQTLPPVSHPVAASPAARPDNPYVQLAYDNGWWSDILALSVHKGEIHQSIKSQMILNIADRTDDLSDARRAVRLISERIIALIQQHVQNEHVIKAKKGGVWDDPESLHVLLTDLQGALPDRRATVANKSPAVAETRLAVAVFAARLSVLRQRFN